MNIESELKPSVALAENNRARVPNESAAYRRARNELLAAEIDLRRQIERVAAMRRGLPPGGEVTRDYAFDGEAGPTTLSRMFGDKPTLVVYS